MKKKINIVLLLLVLCLWGTVAYKYINQYFFKPELSIVANKSSNITEHKIISKDTFELQNTTRDPFLNKIANEKKVVTKRVGLAKAVLPKKTEPVIKKPFPKIQYYGYIKSGDKSPETILLNKEGKFLKLSLNQEKDGIKILALRKDSIKVSYNKEVKWVLIKK